MTTNFELNLELESMLEKVHSRLDDSRKLVARAQPNSVSAKLIHKLDFLETSLATLKAQARLKERWP